MPTSNDQEKRSQQYSNQLPPWRTFSIFISSTFADMQAERDHLKNFVFPKVEEELRKKRIALEIVDLRWGVDTASVDEGEREATVLKVCLDEIRRCKPFFIGLLGDRYGWVPPTERMKNATVGEKLVFPDKGKSVTALEMEFGVLADKEQLSRSIFRFRNRLPYEEFEPAEKIKYCDDFNTELSDDEKAERKASLEGLKTTIKAYFESANKPEKVKKYTAKWDQQKQAIYGLQEWGDEVAADILAECAGHASDTWENAPKNQFEEQQALLDAFIESHTHINTISLDGKEIKVETFCGREKLLRELKEFLLSSEKDKSGIVLTGESGSGKSAVFSMVYRMMQQADCLILAHSAGISPDARSVAWLLQSWNRQMSTFLQLPDDEEKNISGERDELLSIPDMAGQPAKTGIEKLQERFRELLFTTAEKTPVVLLVDALDSFEPTERAAYMTWLPATLPANSRLLVSAITSTEKRAVQFHKGFETRNLNHFTPHEAAGMLKNLCFKQHKTLSPLVTELLLSKQREDGLLAAASPLWLSLAVNNLIAIDADDFEKMSASKGSGSEQVEGYLREIAGGFKSEPAELFLQLIDRAKRLFGDGFTQTIFDAIACSRNGLRESDLEAIVNIETYEKWDALRFASLRRWFKSNFKETGEGKQWSLAHSILRNTLKQKMDARRYNNVNVSIANHLLSLPNGDTSRISETMYHLMQANDKRQAVSYYTSKLGREALVAATKVLAEIIAIDEKGLEIVTSLPGLTDDEDKFLALLKGFVFDLNDLLAVEGNLNQRLNLLNCINNNLEKRYSNELHSEDFSFNEATLYSKLGEINEGLSFMEKALNYYKAGAKLYKELHDANPSNEPLKHNFAVSLELLGDIHQKIGKFKDSLNYYELSNKFSKELSDANPHNVLNKNRLALSFSSLGEIHLDMGETTKALSYFELFNTTMIELCNENPNNEMFRNNLRESYSQLGTVFRDTGHLDESLNYFEMSNKVASELHDANPNSQSYKNGLAMSYSDLGIISRMLGRAEKTLYYFNELFRLAKELYLENPSDDILKYNFAFAHEKLGSIHQLTGNHEAALSYFQLYTKLSKELYEVNPTKVLIKENLGISYGILANIYKQMYQFEESLNYFELCNKIYQELFDANPQKESFKHDLAVSYKSLGIINQSIGHIEKARSFFELYNKLSKELYDANPSDELNKVTLSISFSNLGYICLAMDDLQGALNYFEMYNQFCKELHNANPSNESIKICLANSFQDIGNVYQAIGKLEKTLSYFESHNKLYSELYDANPLDASLLAGLAISFSKLGNIYYNMGDTEQAVNYFETYSKLSKELYDANPLNPSYKKGLAAAFLSLGEVYLSASQIKDALLCLATANKFFKQLFDAYPLNQSIKTSLAVSNEKLGDIYEALGAMERALECYEKRSELAKELYDGNPLDETLQAGLGISYGKLGEIHQAMNHMDKALIYFELYHRFFKDINNANPGSIQTLEGLAFSHYKLAIYYKVIGNHKDGKKHFVEWKNIVSYLTKNVPRVPKYRQWDKAGY